jgi:hypothetical protein
VFALADGVPVVLPAEKLPVGPGATDVGDGAVRYREALERGGAPVPPDADSAHVPWARHHAGVAADFGPAALTEPIYLRVPDAEKALAR